MAQTRPAFRGRSPPAGCTVRAWIGSAAGVRTGTRKTRANSTTSATWIARLNPTPTLFRRWGSASHCSQRGGMREAAAQESPPPAACGSARHQVRSAVPAAFPGRREALGQRVVRLPSSVSARSAPGGATTGAAAVPARDTILRSPATISAASLRQVHVQACICRGFRGRFQAFGNWNSLAIAIVRRRPNRWPGRIRPFWRRQVHILSLYLPRLGHRVGSGTGVKGVKYRI